jgi:hypothetical protein
VKRHEHVDTPFWRARAEALRRERLRVLAWIGRLNKRRRKQKAP